MNRSAGFWNRIARRYSRSPVPDEAVYARKLELTQEQLQPHMQLLEVGCGTGSTALEHAPHVAHIHAIDFSQNMIDIARQKQLDAGVENITFECCTLDELQAAGASYDAILGLSVFHLIRGWREAIEEVHRLQNVYAVAFFRRYLNGEAGYDYYLQAEYAADNEPDVTYRLRRESE